MKLADVERAQRVSLELARTRSMLSNVKMYNGPDESAGGDLSVTGRDLSHIVPLQLSRDEMLAYLESRQLSLQATLQFLGVDL